MKRFTALCVAFAYLFSIASADEPMAPVRPLVLAHYMPWFVAKPTSPEWGYHWTMNHFDPEQIIDGKRSLASVYYPAIGPYDSSNEDVIEYHLLLMSVAGIDGIIVDWYGLQDCYDYPMLHRNTTKLIEYADQIGMKFSICYEDQTLVPLVEKGIVKDSDRVKHVASEIRWLNEHWFPKKNHVRINGKPVMLSFGNAGLSNEQWTQCVSGLEFPIAYFSEHHRRDGATGAFDWPIPGLAMEAVDRFVRDATAWEAAIPVVFPRFVDAYGIAKVRDSYPNIEDEAGKTFRETLRIAQAMHPAIIQIATWNDWGEGTVIEPSEEFGDRDLRYLQSVLKGPTADSASLQLPGQLLRLRRSGTASKSDLDRVAEWIRNGDFAAATSWLQSR
ncbi:hypothetical protein Poly51_47890 [Rubripirellula tenax]|uniref:Glycosyl hydrolase family 71 n=1 Tax=Rubripirellula tenax TaxID=2528015 RepID=A0A5C6EKA6_9BACT|nr:glycoside hydrolase family 71/99-like protein [Rubripirellula tenax]TWU48885.1 hypothetical protein Poly51_47890 [Rubripirellula tenax]